MFGAAFAIGAAGLAAGAILWFAAPNQVRAARRTAPFVTFAAAGPTLHF